RRGTGRSRSRRCRAARSRSPTWAGSAAGIFSPSSTTPRARPSGLARAAAHPVFVDGQIAPRLTLPLALSYDHRLIDGADAARFLRWVAEALQQPLLLALERSEEHTSELQS